MSVKHPCARAGARLEACHAAQASADTCRIIPYFIIRRLLAPLFTLIQSRSQTYERGEHIVDPHTGAPPTGVLSVTVVDPGLATTDAYPTAAHAVGKTGSGWTARLVGYVAMTILTDETVLDTPGFPVI